MPFLCAILIENCLIFVYSNNKKMTFKELPLCDEVLQGLDAMNFVEATPVQEQTIPVILAKKDVIACAQTGTG